AAPARDERSALVAARENLGAGSTSELADYVSQLLSDTKTEESRTLAEAIQAELVAATGAPDRGVKEAGFVVLLGLRVPSALVELGFLTNADEGRLLSEEAYRDKLARGVAAGILRYVRSNAYIP
ncbi:N-acetylmuramoyl-L-alanine amidase, partial [Candidatus Poribacteria bacterium]|nr:N-acetylmuramoyl-L-alanine amidase [Candidatus Poribacteria bacterium]